MKTSFPDGCFFFINPEPTNRVDLPDRLIATKWLQIVKVYLITENFVVFNKYEAIRKQKHKNWAVWTPYGGASFDLPRLSKF